MTLNDFSKNAVPEGAVSVGDFNRRVKELLEGGIPSCWVRGEVSNLKRQASGHLYFTLKDAESQLSCVLFRGNAARQSVELRDGQSFRVLGEVSVYLPRGTHQLVCREVQADGLGRLQAAYEALRGKLAAEGLFAVERRKRLPVFCRRVGFVTSASGAAWKDFTSILARLGWGGEAVLIPAQVQGAGSAASVVGAIRRAAQPSLRLELLVVGRGGGSLEDLWTFNEEAVVRAVAGCRLPTISAVGHEIDVTLCDFAADVRAETPSAAAELLAAAQSRCREAQVGLAEALEAARQRALEAFSVRVSSLSERLRVQSPQRQLEAAAQRHDEAASRLEVALRLNLEPARRRWQASAAAWRNRPVPAALLPAQERRGQLAARLQRAQQLAWTAAQQRTANLAGRLEQAGLSQALQRGFLTAQDASGQFITRRAQLTSGQRIHLHFADGPAAARVEEG